MKRFKEITEKLGRQLKDPKKEVMVVKKVGGKDKVITIDKSQEKDYLRKGWKLAEDIKEYGGPMVSPAEYKKMGAKMRKAGAPPMSEGKMKGEMMRRQDMAKLAGLYSKAMKAMPGSPKQKALKKQIDQYRRELGMNEEMNHMYEGRKRVTIGGTDKKGGVMFIGTTGIKKMIELSKKNPSIEYTVKSDNYGEFKPHWLKNGKFAKQTVANIHYDLAKNAVRGAPKGKTVQDTIFSLMYQVNEAVSPAQQAAIAISKKERGEKPKNEEVKYPHMMYSPDGEEVEVKSPEEHDKYAKKGYKHEKPEIKEDFVDMLLAGIVGGGLLGGLAFVMGYTAYDTYQRDFRGRGLDKKLRQKFSDLKAKLKNKNYRPSKKDIETAKELGKEVKKKDPSAYKKAEVKVNKIKKDSKTKLKESRAYRDAMRSMSRGGTKGMATTKKDKDIEASDDDRKAASKNIIMQLRKAADLPTGAEVEFAKGKGKVDRGTAQAALARFNALAKPRDKEKFQNSIRSLSDIKAILKRK